MKKFALLFILVSIIFNLTACGKKCYECGKVTDRGHTLFGNFYCEDCSGL